MYFNSQCKYLKYISIVHIIFYMILKQFKKTRLMKWIKIEKCHFLLVTQWLSNQLFTREELCKITRKIFWNSFLGNISSEFLKVLEDRTTVLRKQLLTIVTDD
uniref:Uncharacterized protein n=1 Tax=Heterorhabditis bacteriophora TaxID=37862 RepID=A0A1I7WTU2_HETBA